MFSRLYMGADAENSKHDLWLIGMYVPNPKHVWTVNYISPVLEIEFILKDFQKMERVFKWED